jgi:hypothetical protein
MDGMVGLELAQGVIGWAIRKDTKAHEWMIPKLGVYSILAVEG